MLCHPAMVRASGAGREQLSGDRIVTCGESCPRARPPVDARATRDVYGSAKRRPAVLKAVRRWESPERDRRAFEFSDSLSNVADVTRMAARVPRRQRPAPTHCADSESRPSPGNRPDQIKIKLRNSNCYIMMSERLL